MSPRERQPTLPASEEALTRLVQHCRELDQHLDSVQGQLPYKSEAPFLFAQLDEGLRRLEGAFLRIAKPGRGGLRSLVGEAQDRPRRAPVRYEFQGSTRAIPLSEVIGFLSHSGKTGLLRVTTRQETFELEFSFGALVHAICNAPPPGLLLGELLVREKLVDPAAVFSALDSAPIAGELLGTFLVRCGRLSVPDLQRVLAIQVQGIFDRMLSDEDAHFGFQEVLRPLRAHGLDVNLTRLLLENAERKAVAHATPDEAAREAAALVEEPPAALPSRPGATPQDRARVAGAVTGRRAFQE